MNSRQCSWVLSAASHRAIGLPCSRHFVAFVPVTSPTASNCISKNSCWQSGVVSSFQQPSSRNDHHPRELVGWLESSAHRRFSSSFSGKVFENFHTIQNASSAFLTKIHRLGIGGKFANAEQDVLRRKMSSETTAAAAAVECGVMPGNHHQTLPRELLSNSSPGDEELRSRCSSSTADLDLGGEESKETFSQEKMSYAQDSIKSSGLGITATQSSAAECLPKNTTSPFRPRSCKVAVIGAGGAGLVSARELIREGHSVVIYEQHTEVGGVWVYDPKVESDPLGIDPDRVRVHSSIYPSLRTNLPRESMAYLDFPFLPKEGVEGRDNRRFPGHREVALYLQEFSEHYNLQKLVKFGIKVEYVGLIDASEGADTQWVVKFRRSGNQEAEETEEMDSQQVEVFDAVVVCNGHYADSRIVHIPGIENWPGRQIHSHNYRFPHPFQDQVVVVIGSANSAEDISNEVADVAKEVHQCARVWTSTELSTVKKGLWQHPMVERACADGTVKFQDGTSTVADVIIHCTGYMYSFPFLDTQGYVSVEDNRVGPLYKHVFPPALAPTLSFVGLPWKSHWIATVLSGKARLLSESEMIEDVTTFYEQLEAQQVPKSYTHNLSGYQYAHLDWLTEQSGHEPVENWRREIWATTLKNKQEKPYTYRDNWEDQELLDEVMAFLAKTKIPSNPLFT